MLVVLSLATSCLSRPLSELIPSAPWTGIELRLQSPYTGVSTPPNPKILKESQKGLPRPPRLESRKCRKSPWTLLLTPFDPFSGPLGLC